MKLYPSCAGTHPSLDAILDLRRREGFAADDVERIDIDVDSIMPTILIYDRPATGLEGKFSLPFCAAAAVVVRPRRYRHVRRGAVSRIPQVTALMARVAMRVDPALDRGAPPLTQARVHIRLRDGRVLTQEAQGARGYPEQPASDAELDAKFLACACRALTESAARTSARPAARIDELDDVRTLTTRLTSSGRSLQEGDDSRRSAASTSKFVIAVIPVSMRLREELREPRWRFDVDFASSDDFHAIISSGREASECAVASDRHACRETGDAGRPADDRSASVDVAMRCAPPPERAAQRASMILSDLRVLHNTVSS